MNSMLQECYLQFARTCPDGKATLVRWVTEVGKIDGGTKAKRRDALLQFSVDPMNDSERRSLVELEKERLVLCVQGSTGERYSISMLGLVHVLRLEPNWLADECISELAKLMSEDIDKSLPQKQKLRAQEICIIFFLIVISGQEGQLNLQHEDGARVYWSLFENHFLDILIKYDEGDTIRKVKEKITAKGRKHTDMRAFMLNLDYLTSSKILVANNYIYSFGQNQNPSEYLPRLFMMSDLKRDYPSRQLLAKDFHRLRDRAETMGIVEGSDSEHFDSAIDTIKALMVS